MSNPETRIRAFVASFAEWNDMTDGGHIHTTGEYGSPDRVSLYATDVIALLDQLEALTRDRDLTARENRELLAESLAHDNSREVLMNHMRQLGEVYERQGNRDAQSAIMSLFGLAESLNY